MLMEQQRNQSSLVQTNMARFESLSSAYQFYEENDPSLELRLATNPSEDQLAHDYQEQWNGTHNEHFGDGTDRES